MPILQETIIKVFCKIDYLICWFIEQLYSILYKIADADIFGGNIDQIAKRIYVFVAVFALFKLSLTLINYILDPDLFGDKKGGAGKLIQRVIIALALIVSIPYGFKKAYELQAIILENNIIGKIFLGEEKTIEDKQIATDGRLITYTIYTSFLDYNREEINQLENCNNIFLQPDDEGYEFDPTYDLETGELVNLTLNLKCQQYLRGWYPEKYDMLVDKNMQPKIQKSEFDKNDQITSTWEEYYDRFPVSGDTNQKLGGADRYLILINRARQEKDIKIVFESEVLSETLTDNDDKFIFSYKWLIASIFGGVVTFIFLMFCIDIAIRAVKLGFLQIVAPIPIILYMDPNGKSSGALTKWLKLVGQTFLELFIKLAAMYFSIYLLKTLILNNNGNISTISGKTAYSFQTEPMLMLLILIGSLMFAKKLPEIISNLTGLELKSDSFKATANAAKKIVGATVTVATAALTVATAGAGGAVSNAAAAVAEKKGLWQGIKSTVAGGASSAGRAAKDIVKNKGRSNLSTAGNAIKGSNAARNSREAYNKIGYGFWQRREDEIKDFFGVKGQYGEVKHNNDYKANLKRLYDNTYEEEMSARKDLARYYIEQGINSDIYENLKGDTSLFAHDNLSEYENDYGLTEEQFEHVKMSIENIDYLNKSEEEIKTELEKYDAALSDEQKSKSNSKDQNTKK